MDDLVSPTCCHRLRPFLSSCATLRQLKPLDVAKSSLSLVLASYAKQRYVN